MPFEKYCRREITNKEIATIIAMTLAEKYTRKEIADRVKRSYVTVWLYQKKYLNKQ